MVKRLMIQKLFVSGTVIFSKTGVHKENGVYWLAILDAIALGEACAQRILIYLNR